MAEQKTTAVPAVDPWRAAPMAEGSFGRPARRRSLIAETGSSSAADQMLERLMGGNELSPINYLMLGLVAARSVGRVVIREDGVTTGHATGFLAAPGVLVTNHHVFPEARLVAGSSIELEYEIDARGDAVTPVSFDLLADPEPLLLPDLDLAVVAVADKARDGTPISAFAWVYLDGTPGKSTVGEFLTIVQHPNGDPKQICVRENRLEAYDPDGVHITYESDTVAGSSGSPVFNNSWNVVALHHSAIPVTDVVDGKEVWALVGGGHIPAPLDGVVPAGVDVRWQANEGIRISAIGLALAAQMEHSELARRIVEAGHPPPPPAGSWPGPLGRASSRETAGAAVSSTVVPLELVVTVRTPSAGPDVAVTTRANGASSAASGLGVGADEKAPVAADYEGRPGYQPKFLGAAHPIALPKVTGARAQDVVTLVGAKKELRYFTYSVLMSRSRRLPILSAANFDRTTKASDDRPTTWLLDPRVDAALQVGEDWYKHQTETSGAGPFDRGHLTAFENGDWGADHLRNGTDTFHFTNCAPQAKAFNENKIWRQIEVWAAAKGTGKVTIFNGPVFDAPTSQRRPDGEYQLNPLDDPVKDRVLHGLPIPKQFFKVAAYLDGGKLAVQSFVVTQEGWFAAIGNLEAVTEVQLSIYRVPLSVVTHLTGITFGPLAKGGVSVNEAAEGGHLELVTSLDALT